MKLIAGLGNPGKEYENTRHNSGFMAMDLLAAKCGADIRTEKWNALTATVRIEGQPVLLMKPLTFMNRSGSAVIQAVDFYKIAPEDVLIIHDDMDLPVGSLRIRKNGSSGGQNGMKSILQAMHTEQISRIRVGVGHDKSGNVPDYVLSPVAKAERELFQEILQTAADAAYAWAYLPMETVMNRYNRKEKKKEEQ
ncbi:MAG: aminoacyl-tRNA hydrolase [Erysipelotrichaceae bacterium]|nr:aminoacyl-tRNA hydrolase [Erysipelotrichaceae bacterium]